MVSKLFVCLNDDKAEDDKAVDNKVGECAWVPGELKSVLGYYAIMFVLRLPRTGTLVNHEVG